MNNKLMPVFLLVGAVFVVALWRNPAVAAQDVGEVLGSVGGWIQDAVAKLAEFVGSFGS